MFSIRWNHRGNWHFGPMQNESMENIIFFILLSKELFCSYFLLLAKEEPRRKSEEPFNYQILKNAKKGASEELYYDIALLSGARIQQIQKMKDEDDDEETQALIRKQEKTLLKVLKYKLKEC